MCNPVIYSSLEALIVTSHYFVSKEDIFQQLLPFSCASHTVGSPWTNSLRLRLVKVCCVCGVQNGGSVVHVECDWNAGSSFLIKVWANFLPFHHLDAIYQYISSLLPLIFRLLYTTNLELSFSVFNFTERVHKTRFHWCDHLICVHDSMLNSVDKMAFDIDGILYVFTTKGNATSLFLSNTYCDQ